MVGRLHRGRLQRRCSFRQFGGHGPRQLWPHPRELTHASSHGDHFAGSGATGWSTDPADAYRGFAAGSTEPARCLARIAHASSRLGFAMAKEPSDCIRRSGSDQQRGIPRASSSATRNIVPAIGRSRPADAPSSGRSCGSSWLGSDCCVGNQPT